MGLHGIIYRTKIHGRELQKKKTDDLQSTEQATVSGHCAYEDQAGGGRLQAGGLEGFAFENGGDRGL